MGTSEGIRTGLAVVSTGFGIAEQTKVNKFNEEMARAHLALEQSEVGSRNNLRAAQVNDMNRGREHERIQMVEAQQWRTWQAAVDLPPALGAQVIATPGFENFVPPSMQDTVKQFKSQAPPPEMLAQQTGMFAPGITPGVNDWNAASTQMQQMGVKVDIQPTDMSDAGMRLPDPAQSPAGMGQPMQPNNTVPNALGAIGAMLPDDPQGAPIQPGQVMQPQQGQQRQKGWAYHMGAKQYSPTDWLNLQQYKNSEEFRYAPPEQKEAIAQMENRMMEYMAPGSTVAEQFNDVQPIPSVSPYSTPTEIAAIEATNAQTQDYQTQAEWNKARAGTEAYRQQEIAMGAEDDRAKTKAQIAKDAADIQVKLQQYNYYAARTAVSKATAAKIAAMTPVEREKTLAEIDKINSDARLSDKRAAEVGKPKPTSGKAAGGGGISLIEPPKAGSTKSKASVSKANESFLKKLGNVDTAQIPGRDPVLDKYVKKGGKTAEAIKTLRNAGYSDAYIKGKMKF